MSDTVRPYDLRAGTFADRYEVLSAPDVHKDVVDLIPQGPDRLALDIGAGSGRDAAWLSSLGLEVIAVEPAAGMRAEGRRRHPESTVRWIDDRLPDLTATQRLGIAFDLILLSAVWMHVPPPSRDRAFRKIATLLKPGGLLVISLRERPSDPDRGMWPAPIGEIEALARAHGLTVLRAVCTPDQLGRGDVRWTEVCLRLPDDGAQALPLLRGIILNDGKSSTYKLALLRAIARVADASPGLAVPVGGEEDAVDIPLGAVALGWLRMYLPLIAAGLPQMPRNRGVEGLGFAREGLRQLMAEGVTGFELRIGASFRGARADALRRALADAGRTIAQMPARYTRYPGSGRPVFEVAPAPAPGEREDLTLDGPTLAAFGALRVPGSVWRTLQRLCAWVEPVLVAEWARLVRT
jgi:protein-L-isoaspartate O-methyltransferase